MDSENVSLIRRPVSDGQKTCYSKGKSMVGIYNTSDRLNFVCLMRSFLLADLPLALFSSLLLLSHTKLPRSSP